MKKIVCLGGGNAMPNVILKELKNREVDLSVISAVLDSGGSSGKLREDYNIIAVGDMRRALLELSTLKDKEIFSYRFEDGFLKGHNLGNLIMAAILIKEEDKVLALNNFFQTKFKVLPITFDNVDLCAELESGEIIKGETNIDIPKHNSKIKKVFLSREANIYKEAYEKIIEANVITIGPGDLYSSLIQILLVSGVSKAFKETKAKIFYVCNKTNKKGETDNFRVSDFEKEIEKYLGRELDYVIFNNKKTIDLIDFDDYNDSKHIGLDLINDGPKNIINKLIEII
ncbi:MAG: YvcK family protein [Candidatus Pacebacteria bacterium]|nr:YvcK family protein [Candidatus Paceibacterota bacterium]